MRLYLFTFTQHPGFFKDRGFKVLLNVKPMHESVLFLIASSEHLFGLQKDVWREKITLLLIGCVTFQDCFQLVQGVSFQFKAFQLTVMFVFLIIILFRIRILYSSLKLCAEYALEPGYLVIECVVSSVSQSTAYLSSLFSKTVMATPKKATRGTLTNEYVRQ